MLEGDEQAEILGKKICKYICKFEALWSFEIYLRSIQIYIHHVMYLSAF